MVGKSEVTPRATRLRRTVGRWLRFTRIFKGEMANWNPKGEGGDPNEEMLTVSVSSRELCVYCDIAKDGSEDVILILAWAWRSKNAKGIFEHPPIHMRRRAGDEVFSTARIIWLPSKSRGA